MSQSSCSTLSHVVRRRMRAPRAAGRRTTIVLSLNPRDGLDRATADGVTTTLLFQGIRTLAFSYGVGLRNPLSAGSTRLAMAATFAAAESVADALARKRVI